MGKECGNAYPSVDWNMASRSREGMHLQYHIQWCPPCPSMKKTWVNWSEFSGGPPRWSGAGTLVLWTEAKAMGLIQHGGEVTSQGPDSCLLEHAGRLFEKMESGCAWCCMVGGQETIIVNWSKNVSDWNQKKTFPAWNSQVLEGLSREVVQSPPMDVFMTWLEKAWAACLFWTEH